MIFKFVTNFEGSILNVDAFQQARCRIILEFRFRDSRNDPVQPGLVTVDVENSGVQPRVGLGCNATLIIQEDVERIAVDGGIVDELGCSR